MEVLNIDFMGPFPPDEYKNTYVLTIIDSFTRSVGLYAVAEQTAKEAARMIMRHVGFFGCPSRIVSDKGTQFTSDLVKELMLILGTDHHLTLVGSKQEDSQAENANKRAQEFLRAMLFERRIVERWSDVLPLVQRIMNAEPNEVTGISPAQLLFGNMVNLDRGIFINSQSKDESTEVALSDWADRMLASQKILLDIATRRQHLKDHKHIQQAPTQTTEFEIGSYVLVTPNPHSGFGKPVGKLTPRNMGPFLVINRQSDKYSCRSLIDDEIHDFHVTRLIPYAHDKDFMDPRQVALRDKSEYMVEKVLAHTDKGKQKKVKDLEFQVKWLGYDDSQNTWEPWKHLRETEALHRYLIDNDMKALVPKKFHENYPSAFPPKATDKSTSARTRTRTRMEPEEPPVVKRVSFNSVVSSIYKEALRN